MNYKSKLGATLLALSLVGYGGATLASAAAASEVACIPSDGIAAYDEAITDQEAVDLWYSWTGGPSDDHAFPGADWQVDNGNHNGFDQSPGLLQRDKGKSGQSDWFYHVVIAEQTHVVHHDAVDPVVCDPESDPVLQIGGFCYDKLNPDLPAAWDNSGEQTFAAEKDGIEDWTTAEKFALCNLPLTSCEPVSKGFQSDWVSTEDGYTFPEHITYPDDNIGWPPIYNAVHTDLTQILAEDCDEPVTVVPGVPAAKDLCGVANDHYGLIADTADIAYTRDGKDIVATNKTDAAWGTLPAGWVDNGDGTATYPFSATDWTHVDCDLPDPYDTFGEWVDGEYGCDDTTVEQTRTVTHTVYSNDEDGEVVEYTVEGEPETQSRNLTPEEIAAKDAEEACAVVVVDDPPTELPPTLAYTGTDVTLPIGIGALTLIAGIAAIALNRRRATV